MGLFRFSIYHDMTIQIGNVPDLTIFLDIYNGSTITFPQLRCDTKIYLHSIDYIQPNVNIGSLESGCTNKVVVQTSIPIGKLTSSSNLKLNCGGVGVTTNDMENQINTEEYNYNLFSSVVERGENSCPPFICMPNTGLQISSGVISFQCDNSYSNKYATPGTSIYLNEEISVIGGQFNDFIISNKVKLIDWYGLQFGNNKFNENKINTFRISPNTNVIINELILDFDKFESNTNIKLSLSNSTMTTINSFLLTNLTLYSSSTVNALELTVENLDISSNSLISSEKLIINGLFFDINWFDTLIDPFIFTTTLIVNDDSIDWVSLDSSYSNNPSIPLIYFSDPISYEIPNSVFLDCNDNVLFSNGNTGSDDIKCNFGGMYDECILIGTNADESSSYDLSSSSSTNCPCTSTSSNGCTIIIKSSYVNGNLNANKIKIEVESKLELTNIKVTEHLFIEENTQLYFDSNSINSIIISSSKQLELMKECSLKEIKGNGLLKSDYELTINKISDIQMNVKKLNVLNYFSPSHIYANNSDIILQENCETNIRELYVHYINQNKAIIQSNSTKTFVL